MSGRIKFHLDENVSSPIAAGLRRRGIDVTTTPEEMLLGVDDETQLAFALSQQRALFTQDDDFLRLHQAGAIHAGIVYCHQGKHSIGEILKTLILIWEWVDPEDICRQIEFI
jgi:predicted nuclease of predicted toxin-antitoxin system